MPISDKFTHIRFSYFPAEAEIPAVAWYLRNLDRKLSDNQASLLISDMKFGRAGLEISWCLTGDYTEALELELERDFEWICRRAESMIQ